MRGSKLRIMAAALVAVVVGCGDEGRDTLTGLRPVVASRHSTPRNLYFNSRPYDNTGVSSATGRSGSAALTVDAFLELNGSVTLEVRSHWRSDLTRARGCLTKVQVKAYAPGGRLLWTRNYNSLEVGPVFVVNYPGLGPGVRFDVQANVKCIDGARQDVVTATGALAAPRPDLAVTGMRVPARAVQDAPTIIAATISELGGARGARGNCVLYGGGVELDRSDNIWVDAGDQVSCAFTVSFSALGEQSLEIRVESVRPGDADLSNNSGSGSLTVVAPSSGGGGGGGGGAQPVPVQYLAFVRDVQTTQADSFTSRWTYPDGTEFMYMDNSWRSEGREQTANVTMTVGRELQFPIDHIDMAMSSGGALIHSNAVTSLPAEGGSAAGSTCGTSGIGSGFELYVCAYQEGHSSLQYILNSGSVVYQSREYTRTWYGTEFVEDVYVVNEQQSWGSILALGNSLSFSFTVVDGGDTYNVSGTLPIGQAVVQDNIPLQCTSGTVPFGNTWLNTYNCFMSVFEEIGFEGAGSGDGEHAGGAP